MSRDPLTQTAALAVEKHLPPGASVAVAVSGGMDSVSLCHALLPCRSQWRLSACHLDHGLSPRAEVWRRFVGDCCRRWRLPLTLAAVRPDGDASEAWARNERLKFFAALEADAVLTAHHADDQAETVLFRLLRGGGVYGLRGMLECRPLSTDKKLIRPWLTVPRTAIADYAARHRLRWAEDEDNRNSARRRNFLRRRVLPQLAGHFPPAALSHSARRFADGARLLDDLAAMDEKAARGPEGDYAVAYFRQIGVLRTCHWLRHGLSSRGAACNEKQIAEVGRQIVHGGGRLLADFGVVRLCAGRGRLFWQYPKTAMKDGG